MKKSLLLHAIAAFLLCALPAAASIFPPTDTGRLLEPSDVKLSDCGGFRDNSTRSYYGETRTSCDVKYAGGKFIFIARNVEGNCCPEKVVSEVKVEGDTISFVALPYDGFCDCICTFDIEASCDGIAPGHYTLKFISMDDPLLAEVDLAEGFSLSMERVPLSVGGVEANGASLRAEDGVVKARCPGKFRLDIYDAAGMRVHTLDAEDEVDLGLGASGRGVRFVRLTPAGGVPVTLRLMR